MKLVELHRRRLESEKALKAQKPQSLKGSALSAARWGVSKHWGGSSSGTWSTFRVPDFWELPDL